MCARRLVCGDKDGKEDECNAVGENQCRFTSDNLCVPSEAYETQFARTI